MKLEAFDPGLHGETLLAVVLGAALATAGGFVATQLEAYFRRRERRRDTALLFGELFSTIRVLLRITKTAHRQGDPFGAITVRLLRAVRREIDIYDRNREALYDLHVATLRVEIHTLIVRLILPLDGILDATTEILRDPNAPGAQAIGHSREFGFEALMQMAERIEPIIAQLARLARHEFSVYNAVGASNSDANP